MRIELVQWIHTWYETEDYKTRYIFTIVFYEHAQMNNRVNRALLKETCQSKNCTIFLGKAIDFSVMHDHSPKSYRQGQWKWWIILV